MNPEMLDVAAQVEAALAVFAACVFAAWLLLWLLRRRSRSSATPARGAPGDAKPARPFLDEVRDEVHTSEPVEQDPGFFEPIDQLEALSKARAEHDRRDLEDARALRENLLERPDVQAALKALADERDEARANVPQGPDPAEIASSLAASRPLAHIDMATLALSSPAPGPSGSHFQGLTDHELELMVLGDFYRTLEACDRLPEDILMCKSLDYETGLPTSANDLKLAGEITLGGEALAREAYWSPDQLAKTHVRRTCDRCEYCTSGRLERCVSGPLLSRVRQKDWTALEAAQVLELRSRIQELFRVWETRGLIDRTPPILWTGNESHERARQNKDTWAARLTTEGLKLARARVPGTEYAHGPRSLLWAMSDEQKRRAPQWAQKEYVAEGGLIA